MGAPDTPLKDQNLESTHILEKTNWGLEEQGLLIAAPLKEVVRFAYDIYLILL